MTSLSPALSLLPRVHPTYRHGLASALDTVQAWAEGRMDLSSIHAPCRHWAVRQALDGALREVGSTAAALWSAFMVLPEGAERRAAIEACAVVDAIADAVLGAILEGEESQGGRMRAAGERLGRLHVDTSPK